MIVMNAHIKLHHGGVSVTVTAIREVYWIPAIRQYVRKLLRRCVTCNKIIGKPYQAPDPPPLPKVRVTDSPPFTVTGVDFTGAVYVKDDEGEKKVYICLFTCAATRAVHLEIVVDLTVETFLLAFRRFSSRKSYNVIRQCFHISFCRGGTKQVDDIRNTQGSFRRSEY